MGQIKKLSKGIIIVLLITLQVGLVSCSNEKKEIEKTKTNILVCAHRGASGYTPENTLVAMKTAIDMGSQFSELDVQETKDGEVVLLHDNTLKRTSGIDKGLWELNYDDIKGLDAGAWFSDEFKGEPIPTLQDVIELVNGKMKLNIELKSNKHEVMIAEKALDIVLKKNFLDQVIFTSFKFEEVDKIRKINKEAKIGYIFGKMPKDINVFTADVDLLSVQHNLVDAEFVKNAKENGKEVHVWTVNKPEEMKRIIECGVDVIITNYPDVLNKVLNGSI